MTDKLIAFFYRERLLVVIFTMLVTAGGILALERLNVDAFIDGSFTSPDSDRLTSHLPGLSESDNVGYVQPLKVE
jgi:Cu/Ag efflux pump CusA